MDGAVYCWKMVVHDFKITPDEGLCVAVLNTAARHGIPDLASDVIRVLQSMDVTWQEHHFAPLVEAFARSGQIKEAIITLDIMRSNNIEPLTETALPIFDAIKDDIATVESTWNLVDELHNEGKKVDISALKAIIKASLTLGDLQRAIGAYKAFPDFNVVADLATFNLLLQGCVAAAHRELGNLLLSDMKELKLKPDQNTYEEFIALCLTQDDYEDAFFYLEELKATGNIPPNIVYEGIVGKCLSRGDGRYQIALDEMKELGYSPSTALVRVLRNYKHQKEPEPEWSPAEPPSIAPIDGAALRFIETGGLLAEQTPEK